MTPDGSSFQVDRRRAHRGRSEAKTHLNEHKENARRNRLDLPALLCSLWELKVRAQSSFYLFDLGRYREVVELTSTSTRTSSLKDTACHQFI